MKKKLKPTFEAYINKLFYSPTVSVDSAEIDKGENSNKKQWTKTSCFNGRAINDDSRMMFCLVAGLAELLYVKRKCFLVT